MVEYLRNNYIETRYIPEGKEWPQNQPKYYVNLSVIHYQGSRTQEEVIFRAQHNRHIDLAIDNEFSFSSTTNQQSRLSNKFQVTREIVDLFKKDSHIDETKDDANSANLPKSILIEGAPGIGKTILLKEIAYRWANGTILNNAKIVFLVYLRDSRFHSVTTINELIQYFDCLEENEIPAVVKQLKQSNGDGVVFLIDGLDEYPGALHNSFLSRLIDRKILSKSVFVITSRACRSMILHNKVERRIEILGFGLEELDEYISKLFESSPEKRKELELYLMQHPMLNSLMYIPFHLSVLLFLFQQGNLPETLTEMNESFILHTVYRHIEKHDIPLSCAVKLADFPEVVHDIIYKLAKLAFQGLQKNQLIFTFHELKQICPKIDITPGALNGFGLLQAVQHYPVKGAGTTVSFNFLHLTMHEFLAAWYVSHCSIEEQKQLLKQSFMNKESWNELDNSSARMWQMYVGIVGVNCDAWLQVTTERKFTLCGVKDPLSFLYYFQCLLEGKSKNLCFVSSPFKNSTIKLLHKVLLPYHIALLCKFLSKSNEQWKYYSFCRNAMRDIGIKLLTNFLLSNKNILLCVSTLDLSFNCLTSHSATVISNIIQEGTLVTLDLSCNDLGESGAAKILQALKINITLKTLFLSFNDIGVNGAKSLVNILCYNHTLKLLIISGNKIMDDGAIAISECFKISGSNNAKLTSVKSLGLSANCLTLHSKTAIGTIIQEGALESLDLSYNRLGESGAYEICKALQTNLTLKQLFLCNNDIGVKGALSIAVALCHNHTLEDLDISNNKILDDGAIAIAECLKTNRTLTFLDVSHNNITKIGTIELIEVLRFNPVFTTLKIDYKCDEILKPYSEQLLYNNVVDRCYRIIKADSADSTYTSLARVWKNY